DEARLGDDRAGAGGHGLADVLAAVAVFAGIGAEQIARAHPAAVEREPGDGVRRVFAGGVRQQVAEGFAEQFHGRHHHAGPPFARGAAAVAAAGGCGAGAWSGATFMTRMAPPTTLPNTGAAASPPW